MEALNVLVSSAGRRGALIAIWRRTLADLGLAGQVLATDMSAASAAFHAADRGLLVPPCSDDEFVPTLLEICRQNGVGVLVPTIDTELPKLAAAARDFAGAGTTINISAPEVIEIGFDKRRTHAWLTANGFPTVEQVDIKDARAGRFEAPRPWIVKPARGSASIGVTEIAADSELPSVADSVVQSKAPGVEYTVDVFVDRNGACVSAVARQRLEVRAGEVSKGITVKNPAVLEVVRAVAESLPGGYGVLNIQVFHDAETGAANVIEINPRYGGGFPLAFEAGARFPRWFVEDAFGLPSTANDDWQEGLVMLRYDDAVFVTREDAGL